MSNRPPPPSVVRRWLLLFALLVVVCASISLITARLVIRNEVPTNQPVRGTHWLSQELGLSPEETARIEAFDAGYRARRETLLETFHQRIAELSELLRTHNQYSPEVTDAVHRLHAVHGQLQALSIEHYYEMLNVLPPDKQDKLRDIAVEALSQPE
ncbi:periplasmic heavy metal sensor [Ruficoccus amylovorans]|uniref:Periplasmic heavy metal sensor n=1 Tax=Ruficoccus amylovorans TaxID=1804625 RepID=A0A842HJ58_9BACT|nr:periplasmic heavy metal sensor [Ruficoccus amylovorans]MBC2596462.1 periplasmic heavy metal sensor [Ruficoccus amylovorans]